MNRRGEDGASPFRTGRFFSIGHVWYVATRDDRDLGPFPTRERARSGLAHYLAGQAVFALNEGDGSPVTNSQVSGTMVSDFGPFLEHLNTDGHSCAMAWASSRRRQIEGKPLPNEERRERLAALDVILDQF
jgi:hypothetical protein